MTRFRRWWIRKLYSDAELYRAYLTHGASFGDAVSYIYMGECIGFDKLLDTWAAWEAEVLARGYRALSIDTLVGIGGYGKEPPELVRRGPGEEVISHAGRYREHWLGTKPLVHVQSQDPTTGAVSAQYILPSTEKETDPS